MKLSDLIASIAEKIGLDVTDESLKELVGSQLDIPEALASGIDSLMTKEAAKNNAEIKKHYLDNMANGQNKNLDLLASEYGLSQEERDEIFRDNKTVSDKHKAIVAKVAEKSKGKDKPDESKAIIEKLNADLREARALTEQKVSELTTQYETERLNDKVIGAFMKKTWSSNFPEDLRSDIAKIAVEKELTRIGASLALDGKSIKIVRSENKEQDYFDDKNKKITFEELRDTIFANNNFGSVSPDTPPLVAPHVQTPTTPQSQHQDPRIAKLFAQSKADQNMQ